MSKSIHPEGTYYTWGGWAPLPEGTYYSLLDPSSGIGFLCINK